MYGERASSGVSLSGKRQLRESVCRARAGAPLASANGARGAIIVADTGSSGPSAITVSPSALAGVTSSVGASAPSVGAELLAASACAAANCEERRFSHPWRDRKDGLASVTKVAAVFERPHRARWLAINSATRLLFAHSHQRGLVSRSISLTHRRALPAALHAQCLAAPAAARSPW